MRAVMAAARPGVPEPVDDPALRDGATAGVVVDGASVGVPARHLPSLHPHQRGGLTGVFSSVGGVVGERNNRSRLRTRCHPRHGTRAGRTRLATASRPSLVRRVASAMPACN